ncbi:MAG TPA: DUF1194 domain-containing protein [Micropepsaceae bacterium]|jgi:hypothetical protein|nr:DUF1194 domain-containing protein [Micropepsaceae bacterium]
MRRNVRASLSAIAASALLAFIGPEVGFAAAPAAPFPLPPTLPSATGPQEVDVELVLAIDTSGSIDYQEAELQRKGIAEAFLSKDVIQAIQSGSLGRIGVSAIYFSSRAYGWMGVPVNWMIVRDQKSAEEFIHTLITAERHSGRGTSISDALELSQRMLERGPFRSAKQVIDVSGDGVNNAGRPVLAARDETLAKGITINALPIIDDSTPQDLDKYFQGCVIGGPGSFVLVAKGFGDFARALRRKLVLEISGLTPSENPSANPLLKKVAATTAQNAPARPAPPRGGFTPKNPPYPGGCDFPMFGGFGGYGGFGNFPER